MDNRPKIAITMGDPAGIGAEIAVKALENKTLYRLARPLVIGSTVVMEDALRITSSKLRLNTVENPEEVQGQHGAIDLIDLDNITLDEFEYGCVSAAAGQAAIDYIFTGIDLALADRVQAVVTGPIHKEAINAAGYPHAGHTEIFAEKTETDDYAMMLADDEMRVIHVSTHVSLREACDLVKRGRVKRVIELADQVLRRLGIAEPRIGVAGLNPHAGEQGLFGTEEMDEILPAIEDAQKEGLTVEGPVPPDTLFSKVRGGQYDIGVAMYHDQGHIPMKVTGFEYDRDTDRWSKMSGVNATVGLPIIRTSVDHGVAFGKAGQGRANPESLIQAAVMAVDLSSNRDMDDQ